jgi:transcriptional regulator with XRE-family HTH domain
MRLAAKLRQIRTKLGLTQQQMFEHLSETRTPLYRGHIGEYETGKREPSLLVLLRYARIVGVSTDVLIDDELDLPEGLSATTSSKGSKRLRIAKKRGKS